jgi:23S rRNA (guanosine2251-2'-O)-methyltransferase
LRGEKGGSVGKIIGQCRDKGAVVKEVDKKKLDFLCGQGNHQGIAAYVAAHEYAEVEDIFALAEERSEDPFIIVCDEIEDPHNLGAIIRTAETTGVHGIIIPKRRNASLSYAVGKTSAGAVEYVPVARVGNLASTLEDLKKRGLWVYTADMDGQNWCETDFSGPVALIVGSEGNGVSRL